LLTEGSGEVLAELFVLLGELPDAVIGGFEPAQQGRLGGALARRNWGYGCAGAGCPQLLDLGAYVGLGVEPRPGNARLLGNGLERDRLTGSVQGA
jgi:hypothetical protein